MNRARLLLPVAVSALVALGACSDDSSGSRPAVVAAAAPLAPFAVITPEQGAALIAARPEVVVVDVRTPEEFAAGHLAGAVLVDVSAPTFDAQLAELPADGAYVVYCRSGNRSAQAVARMADAGFTEVYDLGGIGAWQAAGYPVVTD